jgi:hypothetical protein
VVLAIYGTGGTLTFDTVKVNRHGVGKAKVLFDGTVAAVEVTLVNASTRYRECYQHPKSPYSCQGVPVDNDKKASVQGKAA